MLQEGKRVLVAGVAGVLALPDGVSSKDVHCTIP
jgi:hypothetical protein